MHKNKKFHTQTGFGLIELMVSISIVVLVTSIILARHDSYNGAILLRSQAYDIALKIREVQLQAVSVVGQGAEYRTPLGVCFDTEWPNYYYIFADNDDDGVCDISAGEQVGQRGNIDPRFSIQSLNLILNGTETKENELAILFERPNFDARFFVGDSEEDVEGVEIGLVRVGANLQSTKPGDLRVMEVSRTGQILVQPVKANSAPTPCTKNCQDPPVDCEKAGNCDDDSGAGIELPPGGDGDTKGGENGGEIVLPPDNPGESRS